MDSKAGLAMTTLEGVLAAALRRLVACPDLGLDELEDETRDALAQARWVLDSIERP